MNQFDLLGAVLSLFNKVKLDDASWLVSVDADDRAERSLEFCVLSIVPDMVAGSGPANTPWQVILSQARRTILSFSPCAFTRCPDHHPALTIHLPVPTIAQKTFLTQHLQEDIVKVSYAYYMLTMTVLQITFCHHLVTLMSFQTRMTLFLLWNCELNLSWNWISLICLIWFDHSDSSCKANRPIHWKDKTHNRNTITYTKLWKSISHTKIGKL